MACPLLNGDLTGEDVGITPHRDRDGSPGKHSAEQCCHPSQKHPSPVCAQACAVSSTAHTVSAPLPVPELSAVPSPWLSSGLPCSGLTTSPHPSDPPNSSSRQRLPGCCRHWGLWPSCGASGSLFMLSKAIRKAQDLSAAPRAAGQRRRVVCHICHICHVTHLGTGSPARGMRQINPQFPRAALRGQAGHTIHSWTHPAAHAGQGTEEPPLRVP